MGVVGTLEWPCAGVYLRVALIVVRVGDDGEQLVFGQSDGQVVKHQLLHLERHVVDEVRHVVDMQIINAGCESSSRHERDGRCSLSLGRAVMSSAMGAIRRCPGIAATAAAGWVAAMAPKLGGGIVGGAGGGGGGAAVGSSHCT